MARKLKESKLVKMNLSDLEALANELYLKHSEAQEKADAIKYQAEYVLGIISQHHTQVTVALGHYKTLGYLPNGFVA